MTARLVLLIVCSMAAGLSCEQRSAYVPSDNDRRLLHVYASLSLLYDSFTPTTSKDSIQLYQVRADSILTSLGFSRASFRTEFEDLMNSPERFEPLFKELSTQLQKSLQQQ